MITCGTLSPHTRLFLSALLFTFSGSLPVASAADAEAPATPPATNAAPAAAAKEEAFFTFEGGSPQRFIETLEKLYHVDWLGIAQIPEEMEFVQVPKMRLPKPSAVSSAEAKAQRAAQEAFRRRYGLSPAAVSPTPPSPSGDLKEIVGLYNRLAQDQPALGKLVVEGDYAQPQVVMLVPDKQAVSLRAKVKAFSLVGIPQDGWEKLREDIELARREGMEYFYHRGGSSGMKDMDGSTSIHSSTRLLVAVGTEAYVEMVDSVVTAHKTGRPAPVFGPPATK